MQRLNQPLPVTALAARSALSPRQFTRQFRQATGTTPHKWLLTQRLALAQRLLETTSLSIDQVAASAGFGTPAAMRLQFQQVLDTSPAAYRADLPLVDGRLTSDPLVDGRLTSDGRNEGQRHGDPPGSRSRPVPAASRPWPRPGGRGSRPGRGPLNLPVAEAVDEPAEEGRLRA